MGKAKKILKDVGLFLLIAAICAVAGVFLFVEKIPVAVEIPDAKTYAKIDKSDYIVETNGIEDAQNETVVYQSTSADLELYTEELRYTTGKTEPLTNPDPGVSDIPTDVIGKSSEEQ